MDLIKIPVANCEYLKYNINQGLEKVSYRYSGHLKHKILYKSLCPNSSIVLPEFILNSRPGRFPFPIHYSTSTRKWTIPFMPVRNIEPSSLRGRATHENIEAKCSA